MPPLLIVPCCSIQERSPLAGPGQIQHSVIETGFEHEQIYSRRGNRSILIQVNTSALSNGDIVTLTKDLQLHTSSPHRQKGAKAICLSHSHAILKAHASIGSHIRLPPRYMTLRSASQNWQSTTGSPARGRRAAAGLYYVLRVRVWLTHGSHKYFALSCPIQNPAATLAAVRHRLLGRVV